MYDEMEGREGRMSGRETKRRTEEGRKRTSFGKSIFASVPCAVWIVPAALEPMV
jgi:hypothetical protein